MSEKLGPDAGWWLMELIPELILELMLLPWLPSVRGIPELKPDIPELSLELRMFIPELLWLFIPEFMLFK